jgi:hypothetical protein
VQFKILIQLIWKLYLLIEGAVLSFKAAAKRKKKKERIENTEVFVKKKENETLEEKKKRLKALRDLEK